MCKLLVNLASILASLHIQWSCTTVSGDNTTDSCFPFSFRKQFQGISS
uniref:Uncharacterized protein n=1 Tax=Setaria viridis TaxID=4556 RepID=A0A4U6W3E0_SETVI|nr:hypothetical protein SEVIR_1G010950v2 [Setaria viridis]